MGRHISPVAAFTICEDGEEEQRQREAKNQIRGGTSIAELMKISKSSKKKRYSDKQKWVKRNEETGIWTGGLTEASVLGEELCELVTVVLAVAAVAAVAVGRDADFGGAQVVGGHHGTYRGWMEGSVNICIGLYSSVWQILPKQDIEVQMTR